MKKRLRVCSFLVLLTLLLTAALPALAEKITIDTETATVEEILEAIAKLEAAIPNGSFMSSSSASAGSADTGKRGIPQDGNDPMTEINVGGIRIKCYYADLTQFSPEEIADIPDTLSYMSESVTPVIRLRGDIQDSYGIGFNFRGQAGKGDPFSDPWCGTLHLSNNSWTRGQGDRSFSYNSGNKYAEVLLALPSEFNQIQLMPSFKLRNWSAAITFTPVKLFFRTEAARDRYLDSIQ